MRPAWSSVERTDRQREIRAVLDGLELDQVVLVGHDSSGPEAIDFAYPNLNPDVAHHLSSLFKKSQLRLVDQASHRPRWDSPEVVADLIRGSIAATAI